MSLINFPECGKEISDKSEMCIHCGYPLAEKNMWHKPQSLTSKPKEDTITCPKCGSSNITEGTRGFTLTTGFVGSGNFRYVCKNCGNKWKPGSMLELLQRANNKN